MKKTLPPPWSLVQAYLIAFGTVAFLIMVPAAVPWASLFLLIGGLFFCR